MTNPHRCTAKCKHTCGEFGGKKQNGAPCGRPSGWGRKGMLPGQVQERCVRHLNGGQSLTARQVRAQMRGPLEGLAPQQRNFVLEYCSTARGNATLAAKLAGYKGDKPHLAIIGNQLLRRPDVREAVDAYLDETKMSAQRVTASIIDLAHITAEPFFELQPDGTIKFVMTNATLEQYGHWIKEIEIDPKSGKPQRVKLHDRHAALRDLARIHRLFGQSMVVNLWFERLRKMSDDELLQNIAEARAQVAKDAHAGGRPPLTGPISGPGANGAGRGRRHSTNGDGHA